MSNLIERLRAGTGGGKHWMDLNTEAADEIERLRDVVNQHRPMADIAQRLDASISWMRDGEYAGNGIGLADMIALRGLLRDMDAATTDRAPAALVKG